MAAFFRRSILACGVLAAAGIAAPLAQQKAPGPDDPYPGSGLTRQQLMDRLAAPDPQVKGAPEQGRILFQALCSNCHIFGDLGQSVGPDLSTVGSRFNRRDLLEAILYPSKTISDQYAMTELTLDDGSVVSGLIALENVQVVFIRTPQQPTGRGVPVVADRIKDRKESTVSMMPEGLVSGLRLEQIDGMLAFLATGK